MIESKYFERAPRVETTEISCRYSFHGFVQV